MKTTTNKKQKNMYTVGITSMVMAMSLSYIICIYKTVVLASDTELNNKKIALLSADINQKEFEYIGQVSSIDLDHAFALGYTKNTEDKIAYFNINNGTEVAVR
jgi:hypothetical protein